MKRPRRSAVLPAVSAGSWPSGARWRPPCRDGQSVDRSQPRLPSSGLRALLIATLTGALSGCAVVTVAGAAVAVGAAVVGTAVDVTVGAVKVTGKAVGGLVDTMLADEAEPPKTDEAAAKK